MRVVIVGGVAGGASCAARLRRLDEAAEIVICERGPHVSFANCGLPYVLGGEIPELGHLLVQTPESLRRRFRIDVRVRTEARSIDRERQTVLLEDLTSGETSALPYDALVLAPGASPLRPPLPGIERPGHFVVRAIPDLEAILGWMEARPVARAVVVGGGYIGLEVAEQLRVRGLEVALVERLAQVMAPLDPELAALLHRELRENGVDLHLGDGVARFEEPEGAAASTVALQGGARLPADLVVLALGVRPEVGLARAAGLEIGVTGGIRVDEGMRTSDPHIWAVGDAVEVRHMVTGQPTLLPLAGPANRQGRLAADRILGRARRYRGTLGTGITRLFSLTVAMTGANEAQLRQAGMAWEAVHLHPSSHAGYYPGAARMALKILFCPGSGRLLGAQGVGRDGVDKRIDVLATALQAGLSVEEVAELELGYAPPFGSAKDPVNLAGMAAGNVRAGDVATLQWHEVEGLDPGRTLLLDVRGEAERAGGALPGSIHIPVDELRDRWTELPRDREIVAYCASGQRSYLACRLLVQLGFKARNLSGAWLTWSAAQA